MRRNQGSNSRNQGELLANRSELEQVKVEKVDSAGIGRCNSRSGECSRNASVERVFFYAIELLSSSITIFIIIMIIFLFQVKQFNLMVNFIEANTPGRNGVNLNK
jgi:hypothetical protein